MSHVHSVWVRVLRLILCPYTTCSRLRARRSLPKCSWRMCPEREVTFARTTQREEPSNPSQYKVRWDKMRPNYVQERKDFTITGTLSLNRRRVKLCSAAPQGPTLQLKVHPWLLVSCVFVCAHVTLRKRGNETNVWMKRCERMEGECGGVYGGDASLVFSQIHRKKLREQRRGKQRRASGLFSLCFFLSFSESSLRHWEKKRSVDWRERSNWMDEGDDMMVCYNSETGTWAVTPSSFPRDDLISAWWSSTTTVTSATTQRRVYKVLNTWEVKLLPSCSWKKKT